MIKGKRIFITVLTFTIMTLPLGYSQVKKSSSTMGLAVKPGEMVIQGVRPGEVFDLKERAGITLTITNNSRVKRTYTVRKSIPAKLSLGKTNGYWAMPDLRWFRVEKEQVTVEPLSEKKVNLFIDIPPEDKYYNQRWCVAISVASVPQGGEKLALQVTPVYYIETEAKADIKEPPSGLIGVAPAQIRLSNVHLGRNRKIACFRVYNNDSKPHTYRIYPYIPSLHRQKRKIIASPNYFWMPQEDWLSPDKRRLRVKPGGSRKVCIDVNVPEESFYVRKLYEGLIFVEDESGKLNFVRVKINIRK